MPETPEQSQKTNTESEAEFKERQNEIIRKNRSRFRNYFVDTWCSENLSATLFAFIKELETLEVNQINKRVIDFLIQLDKKERNWNDKQGGINLEDEIINVGNRSYNISLGDVCYTLDKISNNYGIRHINNFVFAVKTMYSFFFYQLFEDKESDVADRLAYLQMQYDLKPSSKNMHLLKMTRMMVLSGYEQLLAGNLIRVTKLSNAIKYNQDNRQSKTEVLSHDNNQKSSYYHLRELSRSRLYILNQQITKNHKEQLVIDSQVIDWKSAFNIWEFFILTAYLNTNHTYFRTQKQCYYLHIPYCFPLNFDEPIIYSSTAILFNIVKFYDCYVLCETKAHSGSDLLENEDWSVFWDAIHKNKEISILWDILNYTEKRSSKTEHSTYSSISNKEPRTMPNHDLERIFIRNMEVLDTLEDYLPYLKRKYISNDEEKIQDVLEVYITFYKKLENFQFSLLPRSIQSIREQTKVTEGKNSISFDPLHAITAFLKELKNGNNIPAQELFYKIMFNK